MPRNTVCVVIKPIAMSYATNHTTRLLNVAVSEIHEEPANRRNTENKKASRCVCLVKANTSRCQ